MLKRVIRLTQPIVEPVTLVEAKAQLRVPELQTTEDDVISRFISAAREQAEQFIDSAICEADFVVVYDSIESIRFCMGYPALSVTSVTYRDTNNEEQDALFTYDPQLNTLFFDQIYIGSGFKVTIRAGQSSDWPESMKQGILLFIADLYTGRASEELVNKAAQMMLMPFMNRPIL